MSATSVARRPLGRVVGSARRFGTGVAAVGTKELRGRMRGRRAFAVLTLYLVLLGVFVWGMYEFERDAAVAEAFRNGTPFGITPVALSAQIGQAIFAGLLVTLTILVAVLAPAFTTGAISLEREKQTLDLLVTTPLSPLGLVVGKLGAALAYVFLLIMASIPFMAIVFLFGGVGPEDIIRAYVLLAAVAVGFGAIGLFVSALVKRTQVATVLTYVTVLVLLAGTWVIWYFLYATSGISAPGGFVPGTGAAAGRPPQQLLWLNPFVADLDLICMTSVAGYSDACLAVSAVTGKPYFGSGFGGGACPPGADCAKPMPADDVGVVPLFGFGVGGGTDVAVAQPPCPPGARCLGAPAVAFDVAPTPGTITGFPRDAFWPQVAASFLVVGLILTLVSARLVVPDRLGRRRWSLRRARART